MENKAALGDLGLLNITLPGTHDSAAFKLNSHIMPGSLPWALRQVLQLAANLGLSPAAYIINWSKSQNLDLRAQLNSGIRFLDLRAGECILSNWVTIFAVKQIGTVSIDTDDANADQNVYYRAS